MSAIYSFTQNQLKVLLDGSGYSEISGIALDNTVPDNATVLNTLNELTNMGIISNDGNSFRMKDEIKQIVLRLGSSSGYAAVRSSDPYLPDKCCYKGEKLLVCCSRNRNENFISAYFADADGLFRDLCDEGYFPDSESDFPFDEDELEEYEKELFCDVIPDKPLGANSSVLFSAEYVSEDGAVQKYMRIVDYYFCTYIACFDGSKTVRELYSRQAAKTYFEGLMSDR